MKLGGIQRCSTIDYPGKLCCVVFALGCSLDCFYCHNRALIEGGNQHISYDEVKAFLVKRQGKLDGVVISGGEPLLQEDLEDFIRYARNFNYSVKLDTNGQHPELLKPLLDKKLLDYVAVDYKAKENDYEWVTGKNGYIKARETIDLLQKYAPEYEVRTTLYPGLKMDDLESLLKSLPPVKRYRLNFFVMPLVRRREDVFIIRQKYITRDDIAAKRDDLLKIQPGLIY